MAQKTSLYVMPIIVIIAVLGVVLYIAVRPDSSPFAKAVQWLSSRIEGFSSPILGTPRCPDQFKFFNDADGESLCCKGDVNPYTHTCEPRKGGAIRVEPAYTKYNDQWYNSTQGLLRVEKAVTQQKCKSLCDTDSGCAAYSMFYKDGNKTLPKECLLYTNQHGSLANNLGSGTQGYSDTYQKSGTRKISDATMCAFKPNVKNPHKKDGSVLTTCNSLIVTSHVKNQDSLCPGAFPHYANVGKCCLNGSDLDGQDCNELDNADVARYCVLGEPKKAGEKRCSDLRLREGVKCPVGLQMTSYTMGEREVKKYGSGANGKPIPVCIGIDNTCIPDKVITNVQAEGIYADKDPSTWKYACSAYDKVNIQRDIMSIMDSGYI